MFRHVFLDSVDCTCMFNIYVCTHLPQSLSVGVGRGWERVGGVWGGGGGGGSIM